MTDILLITPPFLQPNCPYPATAYLSGYLRGKGFKVEQFDLSARVLRELFSAASLAEIFAARPEIDDDNIQRMYVLRRRYIETIDCVMNLLDGSDNTAAELICSADMLPQGARFESVGELDVLFGTMGVNDCAKFLATLYLQDISDYIRATVSENFEIVRYAERISLSIPDFSTIEEVLSEPTNIIEDKMLAILKGEIARTTPRFVGFSIPFPGNLVAALRCSQYIKANHPEIKVILGGGYPTTELRNMSAKDIFKYADFVVLDDGELPLQRILEGGELVSTYTAEGFFDTKEAISHAERGCADFVGLDHSLYFSLLESVNPMHKMWGDGRWNKMMLSHGCYWAKCAFCDTALPYIGCYNPIDARMTVDFMEQIIAATGSHSFHFVDEAASPKVLKELSLEILRRGLKVSWWTNVRYEMSFTGDLCNLLSAAGCLAISGGLEVASDRLLVLMNKGISVEDAALVMRNFYNAGIMVHAYLMYGFPTQTIAETVDSLEIVRQLFKNGLLSSAFWHRYAMTCHSPSGLEPERFSVKIKNKNPNSFANNDLYFAEDRRYNVVMAGDALKTALYNYMVGEALDKPVHKWFQGKQAETSVRETLVSEQFIRPDDSRIYDPKARLLWIGNELTPNNEGVVVHTNSHFKHINFTAAERDFLIEICSQATDLDSVMRFGDVEAVFERHCGGDKNKGSKNATFLEFYHSKKWDILRGYGLLQI